MAVVCGYPTAEILTAQKGTFSAIEGTLVTVNLPNGASANELSPVKSEPPLSRAESPILYINEDVFALVVVALLQSWNGFRSVVKLSMCCRRFRHLSLPFVFSRCAILGAAAHQLGPPPLNIRPHVRHLTFRWAVYAAQYLDGYRSGHEIEFGLVLRFLPRVCSLTFTGATSGVPWTALATCLGFPQIKAISFTASACFLRVPPFPTDASSTMSVLEELSYPTSLMHKSRQIVDQETGRGGLDSSEAACLSTLTLGMSSTARSLVLPMQTAPFHSMATVDWPALRNLTLAGAFLASADPSVMVEHMSSTFLRMPALEGLVITAALPRRSSTIARCCVLGVRESCRDGLQSLRKLTIAYPDPNDNVFSSPLAELTKLSLRDWPRHYDVVTRRYYSMWSSPILSATEALSVLRRLRAPSLTTLELVYTADEADDDLLAFIAHGFPRLKHLQLHRYRRSKDETVDFRRIARTLSALKALVTLRLNLDFKDDPGEYNPHNGNDPIQRWEGQLSSHGWEILDILDPCPHFDGVALLFHGDAPSRWIWYARSERAGRKPITDLDCDTFPPPFSARYGRRGIVLPLR